MASRDNPSGTSVPSHLRGRQLRGGPTTGALQTFSVALAETISATAPDASPNDYYIIPHGEFKVISCSVTHGAKTLTPRASLRNSDHADGATEIGTIADFQATVNTRQALTMSTDDSLMTIPRNGRIACRVTCAAGEDVTNACFSVTGYYLGFPTDDPADD